MGTGGMEMAGGRVARGHETSGARQGGEEARACEGCGKEGGKEGQEKIELVGWAEPAKPNINPRLKINALPAIRCGRCGVFLFRLDRITVTEDWRAGGIETVDLYEER